MFEMTALFWLIIAVLPYQFVNQYTRELLLFIVKLFNNLACNRILLWALGKAFYLSLLVTNPTLDCKAFKISSNQAVPFVVKDLW